MKYELVFEFVANAGALEPTGSERVLDLDFSHLPKCWDGETLRQAQKGEPLTGFSVESETFGIGRKRGRLGSHGV